jgi:hypothetical protein
MLHMNELCLYIITTMPVDTYNIYIQLQEHIQSYYMFELFFHPAVLPTVRHMLTPKIPSVLLTNFCSF